MLLAIKPFVAKVGEGMDPRRARGLEVIYHMCALGKMMVYRGESIRSLFNYFDWIECTPFCLSSGDFEYFALCLPSEEIFGSDIVQKAYDGKVRLINSLDFHKVEETSQFHSALVSMHHILSEARTFLGKVIRDKQNGIERLEDHEEISLLIFNSVQKMSLYLLRGDYDVFETILFCNLNTVIPEVCRRAIYRYTNS